MNIDILSNEQVRNVLKEAIKDGAIDEDRVDQMVVVSPSDETKMLVDAAHLLFCSENHDTKCLYYQEEQLPTEEIFSKIHHMLWMQNVMHLMGLTKAKTIGEMTRLVRKVTSSLAELEKYHPGAPILLRHWVNATPAVRTGPFGTQPKSDQKTKTSPDPSPS